ncbi:hypothetical protein Gohar_026889, partial [Gossypium harknessii]|nr:hypothetical protein [Gossypium harknessii]
IYKKISELSTLCGGEILFIIFSPTGKPYSFGHPFVETITKRILNPNQPLNEIAHASAKAYHKDKQVDSYLTVSLNKDINGFIERLV